jgi:YNFM family putative membrane transporter
VRHAPSLTALIGWRFAQGLLLPFIFTVTVAYIGDETEGADSLRLAGDYAMGTIFGGFAGRFVAGQATDLAGWRSSFLLLTGLVATAALVVQATLPSERNFRPVRDLRQMLRAFRDHLTNKPLIATWAVGFGVLFTIVTAFTYANFLLAAPPYGLGPAALGSIFVVYLFGLVSTPVTTRMAVRIGRRPTLAGATALGFCGFALTLLPHLSAIIAGLGLIACAVFAQQTLALSFIGVAARHAKSTAVGLYVTWYYVGGSLGGILPGGIWLRAGWPGCVMLAACMQIVVTTIGVAFWRDPGPAAAP